MNKELSKMVNDLLIAHQDMLYQEYVRRKEPSKTVMRKIESLCGRLKGHGVEVDREFLGLEG